MLRLAVLGNNVTTAERESPLRENVPALEENP